MSKYSLVKVQKIEEKLQEIVAKGGLSDKENILCNVSQFLIEYVHLLNDDNTDLREDVERLEFELDDKRFEENDTPARRRRRQTVPPPVTPPPFSTTPRDREVEDARQRARNRERARVEAMRDLTIDPPF